MPKYRMPLILRQLRRCVQLRPVWLEADDLRFDARGLKIVREVLDVLALLVVAERNDVGLFSSDVFDVPNLITHDGSVDQRMRGDYGETFAFVMPRRRP